MKNIFMIYFKIIYTFLKKLFCVNSELVVFIDNNTLNNTKYLYEEILRKKLKKRCVFITKNIKKDNNYPTIFIGNPKAIFYLATSSIWIVHTHLHDFLKWKITPPKKCKYIQIWHATGAIKKFGQDSVNEFIEEKNILIRERNYLTAIVVTSETWKKPFSTAFGVSEEKVKILGSSRTDIFFNEKLKQEIKEKLEKQIPEIKNKKVILYAPTFRDNDLVDFNLKINFKYLKENLGEEYIFLVKLHPHIKDNIKNSKEFINLSDYGDINELLMITDYLITDYSSVALDYCYLEKPIIFYAYDLENYKNNIRGFYYDYETFIPKNSLAKTNEEILKIIKEHLILKEEMKKFRIKNHKFNDGKSSERIIEYLFLN